MTCMRFGWIKSDGQGKHALLIKCWSSFCGSAPAMPQPGCINACMVSKAVHAAGHTASWGRGYPDLLADCYNASGARTGAGPLDPTRNGTYGALWHLLREAAGVFPDAYVHLGGDEVDLACWEVRAPGFRVWSVPLDAHIRSGGNKVDLACWEVACV